MRGRVVRKSLYWVWTVINNVQYLHIHRLRPFVLPTRATSNCSCLVQIYHAVDQSPASGLYLPGQALDFPLEPFILFG